MRVGHVVRGGGLISWLFFCDFFFLCRSCGCILAELLTGDPLFPGEDEHDQILRMVALLGMPPLHMIESSAK